MKNDTLHVGRGFTPMFVTVCLTEKSWKQATRKQPKSKVPPFPADLHASCTFFPRHDGYSPFCLVTIQKRFHKTRVPLAGLLTHEAVHCKQYAEQVMGTTFDAETEAYYVQHVSNAIHEWVISRLK